MVKLVLQTADWSDATETHSALSTEASFLYATITAEFNRPAKATVTLADPTGSIMRKYDVDAAGNSVYVGPGRAYIYDDDDAGDASVFDGRILRVVSNLRNNTVILECEDWLSQHEDMILTYDMREELNAAHLRQSTAHADPDNTYWVKAATRALAGAVASDDGVMTDETDHANDSTANDMHLFPAVMAIGDEYYFGFSTNTINSFWLNLTTQGVWTGTVQWNYSQGAAAWATLTSLGWAEGQRDFECAAGWYEYDFTLPGDWALDTINGVQLYWIRARVTALAAQTTTPLGGEAYGQFRLYDDAMSWDTDIYASKFFCFTGGMTGTQTIHTGPYIKATDAGTPNLTDFEYAWVKDAVRSVTSDADSDFDVQYGFRMPVLSYTNAGTITAARVHMTYRTNAYGVMFELEDKSNPGTYWELEALQHDANGIEHNLTVEIPAAYLTDMWSTDDVATLNFDVDYGPAVTYVHFDYLHLEIDIPVTQGIATAFTIKSNSTNYLVTRTQDPTAADYRAWEGIPYSIADYIYTHIDTGTSGTLVSGACDIYTVTAAANVEHTSGISLRNYKERTYLQILQDLAIQDAAVFWVPVGTCALTWKSTFNNGAPTAVTDTSVLSWQGDWNYASMHNKYHVHGARIGDTELYDESYDTTSHATYGIYRGDVATNTGLFTDYDIQTMADTLVDRDKDVRLFLEAELPGLSALRLGSEVSITSTYLGLTAAVYTVTHWSFDDKAYRTFLRLHPRSSLAGYTENVSISTQRNIIEGQKVRNADTYAADLTSHEVS